MGGIFKLWFELPKSVFPTVRAVMCMLCEQEWRPIHNANIKQFLCIFNPLSRTV